MSRVEIMWSADSWMEDFSFYIAIEAEGNTTSKLRETCGPQWYCENQQTMRWLKLHRWYMRTMRAITCEHNYWAATSKEQLNKMPISNRSMLIEEKRAEQRANGSGKKVKKAMIVPVSVYAVPASYVSNWKHHKYRMIHRTINKRRILQYTRSRHSSCQ